MDKNNQFISRLDLEEEDHQLAKIKLRNDLSKILIENDLILDIGANRGQFALEIIENFPKVKIFCFEPVPNAFNDLKEISKNYSQISTFDTCVSNITGEVDFYLTNSDVGSSLLEPLPNQSSKWLTLEQMVRVNSIRLDDFIKERDLCKEGETIGLLKTDAQGADLEVLLSAGKYLEPNLIRSILVELNFRSFYKFQQNYFDIFSNLDSKGYRPAWIYPHRSHDEWLWWADVLFIPK